MQQERLRDHDPFQTSLLGVQLVPYVPTLKPFSVPSSNAQSAFHTSFQLMESTKPDPLLFSQP